MNTPRPMQRAAALLLSALLTAGLFSGIDHLAVREGASAVWAAAVLAVGS